MDKRQGNSKRGRWGLLGGMIAGGTALAAVVPIMRRRGKRVTTILKKDHRLASGLLTSLQMTPRVNGMVRRRLMDQIYHALMAHERAEDEVLYEAIGKRGFGQAEPQVEDAYLEQNSIKQGLEELADTDPMSDRFADRLREFKRAIEQHADREERHVFKVVETQMSKEEQEHLGERLRSKKKDLKSQRLAA